MSVIRAVLERVRIIEVFLRKIYEHFVGTLLSVIERFDCNVK